MWRLVLFSDFLFTKASKVLEEAKEDAMIHHAACNSGRCLASCTTCIRHKDGTS